MDIFSEGPDCGRHGYQGIVDIDLIPMDRDNEVDQSILLQFIYQRVISPLLANLYMHYCVDKWLEKFHPSVIMVRYADDLIIHCRSRQEAVSTLTVLK